jgi:hypothetical protein
MPDVVSVVLLELVAIDTFLRELLLPELHSLVHSKPDTLQEETQL